MTTSDEIPECHASVWVEGWFAGLLHNSLGIGPCPYGGATFQRSSWGAGQSAGRKARRILGRFTVTAARSAG